MPSHTFNDDTIEDIVLFDKSVDSTVYILWTMTDVNKCNSGTFLVSYTLADDEVKVYTNGDIDNEYAAQYEDFPVDVVGHMNGDDCGISIEGEGGGDSITFMYSQISIV